MVGGAFPVPRREPAWCGRHPWRPAGTDAVRQQSGTVRRPGPAGRRRSARAKR